MNRFGSISLFKIFGIQLELHITFVFLLALVGWQGWSEGHWVGAMWSVAMVCLVFACVVLHELGHCLIARRYKVQILRIVLLPIGGMAQFSDIPRQPAQEFLITAAGPLVNFVLAGLIWLFLGVGGSGDFLQGGFTIRGMLELLLVFNLVMGLFNLIPVFPMDGGRLLRAFLALRFSYLTATRIAVYLAKPLALLGVVFALAGPNQNWMLALLFAFIFLGGDLEYQMIKRRETLQGLRVGDVTRQTFRVLTTQNTLRDLLKVMHKELPTEVIILDGESLHRIVTDEDVKLLANQMTDADCSLAEIPPREYHYLQAECPLELLSEKLLTASGARYIQPVISDGRFVGIYDSSRINDMIRWKQVAERTG